MPCEVLRDLCRILKKICWAVPFFKPLKLVFYLVLVGWFLLICEKTAKLYFLMSMFCDKIFLFLLVPCHLIFTQEYWCGVVCPHPMYIHVQYYIALCVQISVSALFNLGTWIQKMTWAGQTSKAHITGTKLFHIRNQQSENHNNIGDYWKL